MAEREIAVELGNNPATVFLGVTLRPGIMV